MLKQPVWIFGNPDYQPDAIPLQILPRLRRLLPQFAFVVKDPHEEWVMPPHLIIIDTIKGIKEPLIVNSLDTFKQSPRVTMHDFDLITNLRWLDKLHRLPPFIIIGLPMLFTPAQAVPVVVSQLQSINSNSPPKNEPHSSCTDHKP